MKLFIALIISINLIGCITSADNKTSLNKENPVKVDSIFLGYGYRESATLNGNKNFILHRGPEALIIGPEGFFSTDTFSVFVKIEDINRELDFSRTLNAVKNGRQKLFDVGNKCLTYKQTGIDTVSIGGKLITISVPIEPCIPFAIKPF